MKRKPRPLKGQAPAEAFRRGDVRTDGILRALPDMMFVLSRDGTYLDFHAPDQTRLLVEPGQFLGKRMEEVLPSDVARKFREAFDEVLRTEQPAVVEYALEMEGAHKYFEARLVDYNDRQCILALVRETTDEHLAAHALEQAEAEVERVARLSWMGALAASIAHDVNQPLAAIAAQARAGLRDLNRGRAGDLSLIRESFEEIAGAADRATDVIHRTFDLFSRHPAGRSLVAPHELVEATLAVTRSALAHAGVAVTTNVPASLPMIRGDHAMLQQVLISLVTNAVEAMKGSADRSLTFESWHHAGMVYLAIDDTGPGLGVEDAEDLFRPFQSRKPGHVGIGLSISRAIVEAHGGVLRAKPRSPRGARLEIGIPEGRDRSAG